MHAQPLALESLDRDQERELRSTLSRWSRRFLGLPRPEFDDAYQSAWRKLLEGEAKGRPTRNLEHALRWGIHNSWLTECRRARRHPAWALETTPERAFAQAAPDAAREAEAREAARFLYEAAATLTRRQWLVLLLRRGWGLSPDEVCRALGISRHTYYNDHAHAIKVLATELGSQLEHDTPGHSPPSDGKFSPRRQPS